MKKLLFAIILFFILSVNSYLYATESAGCKYKNEYYVKFIKEYEGNDNTSEATFRLYSLNKDNKIIDINKENDYYQKKFTSTAASFDDREVNYYYSFLTENQKSWINSINSFDDLYSEYESGKYTFNYDNKNSYLESIRNSNGIRFDWIENIESNKYAFINIYTFGIIEEERTPSGYQKEKYIIPIVIEMDYSPENGFVFQFLRPLGFINLDTGCGGKTDIISYMLKYSKDINYNNLYEALNSMDDSYIIGNSCNINFNFGDIYKYEQNEYDYPKDGSCNNVIVNKKGVPNIVATGTLNNEENITIDEETPVSYKLVVKNDSNTPSSNNVIKSIIPKKVEYVRGSASHNGVYNEEENSITWNIDLIDTDEEITLTYEVKVPSDTSTHYDFTTSIKSDEVGEVEDVKNTVTTTKIDNPKTGDITQYIIVILLGISMVAYLIVLNKKNVIQNI